MWLFLVFGHLGFDVRQAGLALAAGAAVGHALHNGVPVAAVFRDEGVQPVVFFAVEGSHFGQRPLPQKLRPPLQALPRRAGPLEREKRDGLPRLAVVPQRVLSTHG